MQAAFLRKPGKLLSFAAGCRRGLLYDDVFPVF
jgi:hypothetical protein